jgi:hypothetical protein
VLPIDQHALGCQPPPGEQERTVVGAESSGGSIQQQEDLGCSWQSWGDATILCS